jgi:hypothetical protein
MNRYLTSPRCMRPIQKDTGVVRGVSAVGGRFVMTS